MAYKSQTLNVISWKNLVRHILVKIELDSFSDLLDFAPSLATLTLEKLQDIDLEVLSMSHS